MNKIKVKDYYLDEEQMDAVTCSNKSVLVVAGAGCGKTMTIIGKIKYLLQQGVSIDEILCISFTNETTKKLQQDLLTECHNTFNVYTFHKLSLNIIGKDYQICSSDYLDYVINEYFEGIIISKEDVLKSLMKYYHLPYKINIYENIVKRSNELNQLKAIISRFIHLMKANNFTITSFNDFIINNNHNNYFIRKHNYYLLRIILDIYQEYYYELTSCHKIDFDDMLSIAIKNVNEGKKIPNYKYILIDEFQDTSLLRCQLIKAIIKRNNSYLFAVGDDFQSIYKFSGCDLSLFLNFSDHFEDTCLKKVTKTYRNSQELINISGKFIMKNKEQITKNLISNKSITYPLIIVKYKNKSSLTKLILSIYESNKNEILILGRNNFDINQYIDKDYEVKEDGTIIYIPKSDIKIRYLTIHKSKGLEASNVIIINLNDSKLGLPSKITSNKVMNLINEDDKYPYSEERRIFYVALTRCKNKVYLFCEKDNISIFVKELIKDNRYDLKIITL